MADHALNCRKLTAQPPLQCIHEIVHRTDRKRRIDDAVKIDDFTGGGFPHSHVVDLAELWELRGEQREAPADFQNARRIGIVAG